MSSYGVFGVNKGSVIDNGGFPLTNVFGETSLEDQRNLNSSANSYKIAEAFDWKRIL